MRILANTGELVPNNGISIQTLQVTKELARRGHRIDLLYLADGPHRDEFAGFCDSMRQVRRLDLEIAPRELLREGPRVLPAIATGVRTHPDVLYVNRYRPLPWALATGTLARAPVVCHVHGFVGIDVPSVNRALARMTARFLCVSRFVRDRFVQLGADPRKVDVVHNGIDPGEYPAGGPTEREAARRELGLPLDPFLVLFYGRVVPDKGIGTLVEALEQLDGSQPVELLVVGPQPDEAFAGRIFATDRLRVHRLPMRTDVVTPLHAADLVAVPSEGEEAFGRTVIEALATGRPVVASAVGGIPEILTGDLARFLVPPSDPQAIADKVRDALDWREQEPRLAATCTAHVADHFSQAAMVDAVETRLVDAVR
jgi:glycosyltransferase involved in cell wall biosynthesis